MTELLITGYIGFDPRRDAKQLPQNTAEDIQARCDKWKAEGVRDLNVRILNCPGGNVSQGLSIHDVLASCGLNVSSSLEGMSASAATLIFQAGKPRRMSANALALIHRATLNPNGNIHDMTSAGQDLTSIDARQAAIYAKRAGAKNEDMLALMDANRGQGRWLSATEAKQAGLVDEVYEPANRPVAMAAADFESLRLPPVPVEYAALFVPAQPCAALPAVRSTPEQTPRDVKSAADGAAHNDKGMPHMKITADQAKALQARFGAEIALAAVTQDMEYADAVSLGAEALAKQLGDTRGQVVALTGERDAAKAEAAALQTKLAAAEAKLADPLKASDKRDPPAAPPTVKPIPEAHAELVKSGKSPDEAFAILRTERPQDYAAHFSMR